MVHLHGPKAKGREFALRSATKDDLIRLDQGRAKINAPQRLRNSHHMIARLAAVGLNNVEIAERVGYTRERVGSLLASPAMKELVAQYTNKVDQSFAEKVDTFFELATKNMIAAERHIADRIDTLDSEGELLGIREALAISRDAADRFGYGKKQTNINYNHDFAADLEGAIRRSGKVIEGSRTDPSSLVPQAGRYPSVARPLASPAIAPTTQTPSRQTPVSASPEPLIRRRA